ncbi:MAG TPA: threonine--tRNA ligase [Actinomycetota bacterium]|nr:threonine--tRNA ligase [Actinomycetota bacterium]
MPKKSDAVCARLPDGTLVDLSGAPEDAEILKQTDPEGREVLRHSTAHVLAQAVLSLFPDARYAGGPAIENPPGFYYDFGVDEPFTPEDLEAIQKKMEEIIQEDQPFEREEVSLEEALQIFGGQEFKLEWIKGIGDDASEQGVIDGTVSIYRNTGKFVDLCRGPHIPSTGSIRAFKLLRSSGAYWRGDENRPMLQRIFGTAFESKKALDEYLQRLEEADRRDHRKLGRELELFMTSQEIGSGLPLWLPNGSTVRRLLEEYVVEEERKAGYQHVYTPHLGKRELYETSGHWQHYRDTMFPPIALEHEELVLRPMNCPHHIVIYQSRVRSYRELPLRLAEFGTMYRFERSGVVSGLSRVRAMNLNDAHIFCTADQIKDEFTSVVRMVERTYEVLGITEYRYRVSLRDPGDKEKYVDNDEMWELGERVLHEVMDGLNVDYFDAPGEAAFYGPKLDIQLTDLRGHEETISTVQLDFHLPDRFGLEYKGEDGQAHRPVMIHRGVIGTHERMMAYLIELYAGAFPTWLAPIQVAVIPIAERHSEYAGEVATALENEGVRVEVDSSNETLGNRVRKANNAKIPYMLIVGDNEMEARSLSVRRRGSREERRGVPIGDFLSEIADEVSEKTLDPS